MRTRNGLVLKSDPKNGWCPVGFLLNATIPKKTPKWIHHDKPLADFDEFHLAYGPGCRGRHGVFLSSNSYFPKEAKKSLLNF